VTAYPNVWLGVSVENRSQGLPRLDYLREIPAVVRFISFEPLLEDLGDVNLNGIHWAIICGEKGAIKKVRSMDVQWARNLIAQCKERGVSVWIKQLGSRPMLGGKEIIVRDSNGRRSKHAEDLKRWPASLRDLKIRGLP
jgi:protein gp37